MLLCASSTLYNIEMIWPPLTGIRNGASKLYKDACQLRSLLSTDVDERRVRQSAIALSAIARRVRSGVEAGPPPNLFIDTELLGVRRWEAGVVSDLAGTWEVATRKMACPEASVGHAWAEVGEAIELLVSMTRRHPSRIEQGGIPSGH